MVRVLQEEGTFFSGVLDVPSFIVAFILMDFTAFVDG